MSDGAPVDLHRGVPSGESSEGHAAVAGLHRLADELPAVRLFPSGISAGLRRWPVVRTQQAGLPKAPGVGSVSFQGWQVDVRGFAFNRSFAAQSVADLDAPLEKQPHAPAACEGTSHSASSRRPPAGDGSSCTRIRPPADVVTLQDRMFYLLQPPLESWLAGSTLSMPMTPFDYQMEGAAFLFPREAALLADEMGLGKTMQAVTAMRLLLHAGIIGSVLLLCPKPLMENWQRELQVWAAEIPTLLIAGATERRHWQWRVGNFPVKIANYELLPRDGHLLESGELEFDLVVLDEAQRIKNRDSLTAQIARRIVRGRSWALTGTPVENRSEDVVSILEFLGLVGGDTDVKSSKRGSRQRNTSVAAATLDPGTLKPLLRENMLRRTKDDVSTQLPPKLYRDASVELLPAQRAAYRLAEKEGIVRLNELGDALSIQHVFELVLRLKQITNFDPLTGQSGKLERLRADLEEVAESGEKALVFSQWVHTLDWLAEQLSTYRPVCYHGKIPAKRRSALIDRFQRDPNLPVMLMSYGAGGVGLNLQCASYVFLYDRWWNPAVEDQAINRVHRLGQQRPVTISRFLTTGTIEDRIDQVLRTKRRMFEELCESSDPTRLGLSVEEVFGLFDLRCPNGAAAPKCERERCFQ